jgi:hypothetical protein
MAGHSRELVSVGIVRIGESLFLKQAKAEHARLQ